MCVCTGNAFEVVYTGMDGEVAGAFDAPADCDACRKPRQKIVVEYVASIGATSLPSTSEVCADF